MKPAHLLLAVSLILNGTLLAVVLRNSASEIRARRVNTSDAASSDARRTLLADAPLHHGSADSLRAPCSWGSLNSDDATVLAQNLTGAGFPRATIRALVQFVVSERFAARRAEFLPPQYGDLPYWRGRPQPHLNDPTRAAALHALIKEEQAQLRQALGPDYLFEDESFRATLSRRYGISDEARLAKLYAIQRDYDDLRGDLFAMNAGGASEALGKSYELTDKEKLADIAAVLTPEEFIGYQMRQGRTAYSERTALATFTPTEDEYRALFQIHRALDDQNIPPFLKIVPANAPDGFRAALENRDAQIAAALPPERYADYRQSIAPGADRLNRLMARLGLPLRAGTPVDVAQADLKKRAAAVRKDATLSSDERAARLSALADEATEKITAVLGPPNFAAYHDHDGGWIDELRAKPRAP